jgi:signal transduction histidine kinase
VSGAEAGDDERRRLQHDLRSPLTIIAGFAEILAGDRVIADEARRDYAQRILTAAKDLRAMLDERLEP